MLTPLPPLYKAAGRVRGPESTRKNFRNFENRACIFREGVLIYLGCRKIEYPGVAKFGIALEWGSRGPEFESRHSDHKSSVFSEKVTFSVYFALGKFHLFEDVFSCGTACGIDDFLMNQRKPKWKDFLSFLEDGFLRRLSSSFSLSIV